MKNDMSKIYELVGQIDEIIICYPDWNRAVEGIRQCIEKTKYYRESVNSLVLGNTGAGKTTICNLLLAEMPPYLRKEDSGVRRIVPAFYCEIPCPTTIKTLASAMLKKLGDPNPSAGGAIGMTKRLIGLLKSCETKVVMFDELHNIFDLTRTSKKLNMKVVGWLKNLINESDPSYCLVGTPVFEPLLQQGEEDDELARRFKYRFHLNFLTMCSSEKSGTLKPFLVEVCKQVKELTQIKGLAYLTGEAGLIQVYAASRGNPSFVMSIIKESVVQALTRGDLNVTVEDFATVIDSGITSQCQLICDNPFKLTKHQVYEKLGRRKK